MNIRTDKVSCRVNVLKSYKYAKTNFRNIYIYNSSRKTSPAIYIYTKYTKKKIIEYLRIKYFSKIIFYVAFAILLISAILYQQPASKSWKWVVIGGLTKNSSKNTSLNTWYMDFWYLFRIVKFDFWTLWLKNTK